MIQILHLENALMCMKGVHCDKTWSYPQQFALTIAYKSAEEGTLQANPSTSN